MAPTPIPYDGETFVLANACVANAVSFILSRPGCDSPQLKDYRFPQSTLLSCRSQSKSRINEILVKVKLAGWLAPSSAGQVTLAFIDTYQCQRLVCTPAKSFLARLGQESSGVVVGLDGRDTTAEKVLNDPVFTRNAGFSIRGRRGSLQ